MTLIRKVPNSVTVNQNPQTENPSQSQSKPSLRFGISDNADRFEAPPENSYFLEAKAQKASLIQPSASRDIAVETSSLFSAYETSVRQLDNHLPQLMDRMDALTQKSTEVQSQIDVAEGELLKAQQALAEVEKLLNSNLPMTDELRKLLEPVGLLGKIAELPLTPAVFGMSILARQKLQEVRAELKQKIGELEGNIESLKSQLKEVQSEMNSVSDKIAKEKERQAKAFSPFQTREPITRTDAIVAEKVAQEFFPNQDLIQNEIAPAVPFNPMVRKNIDE